MKPANSYYHLHYGILLKRLGDNAGAMKEMNTAERLNPSYALTHYELGSLCEKLGNYPQARKQLEAAVDLNPQLSAAYYHLRGVYQHLGLPDQSRRAYDQFRLTQPRGEEETPDPAATAISAAEIEAVQHQP
jgi:tetratricopeptide (TPR) repeat protein